VDNGNYIIKKVLNNNAVAALDKSNKEVILSGKGIGFQRAKGDIISNDEAIEKVFVLNSDSQYEQMLRLFSENDESVMRVVAEYVRYVEKRLEGALPSHFLLVLIDHLAFVIKRLQQGINIHNPFLYDVRILYPQEYALAQEGVNIIQEQLNISIPDDEIAFLALHLHSGRINRSLSQINIFTELITKLIRVIEIELALEIDRTSLDYVRLLTHIRFLIEQAESRLPFERESRLSRVLQREYPLCYNVAWKLVKILQNELQADIPEAEAGYIAMHLQRILEKSNS